LKIAILGAGIAGMSTAMALSSKGFDVVLYKRRPFLENMGAGVVLWPNASFVLNELGILSDIEQVAGRPTRMRRVTKHGENLGVIDIQKINAQMGYSSYSILRSDLQKILFGKLQSLQVPMHFNHEVTLIDDDAQFQAKVQFQNGANIRADIIIGADGRMLSHSRRYIIGDNQPMFQHFINWIGVYESDNSQIDHSDVLDYWGTGERFGIVPVSSTKAYWAGGIHCQEITQRDPKRFKAELLNIFSEWPDAVVNMIVDTPSNRINKLFVHDHSPVSTWHKNNVIMIGDAAHAPLPTSGQGACQALEDAWHLSAILSRDAGDLPSAFARFTQIRFEKTRDIILGARNFAISLFTNDQANCQQRNLRSINTNFDQVASAMASGWSANLPICA